MATIRPGKKEDLPAVLRLIKELAVYEKMPEEVLNTVSDMERDGFGENPIYGLIVAEKDGELIGYSIYYYRYSTWKGKRLYLEDILVTESERGSGVGKLLFDETIAVGKLEKCTGMMWQVLDWNEPAINFYKKYGADFDNTWVNCSIDF